MEFLQPILGDGLYKAVVQKLAGREDVKLANLAQGGYVGKEKFLSAAAKITALEAELAKAKEIAEGAVAKLAENETAAQKTAGLEAQIAKLVAEKEQMGRQFEQMIVKERLETAIQKALAEAKAKNMKAVRALLDETQLKLENGKLIGLIEQIAEIKQSDPYLFDGRSDTGSVSNPTKNTHQTLSANPDRLDDKTFYNLKFKK